MRVVAAVVASDSVLVMTAVVRSSGDGCRSGRDAVRQRDSGALGERDRWCGRWR